MLNYQRVAIFGIQHMMVWLPNSKHYLPMWHFGWEYPWWVKNTQEASIRIFPYILVRLTHSIHHRWRCLMALYHHNHQPLTHDFGDFSQPCSIKAWSIRKRSASVPAPSPQACHHPNPWCWIHVWPHILSYIFPLDSEIPRLWWINPWASKKTRKNTYPIQTHSNTFKPLDSSHKIHPIPSQSWLRSQHPQTPTGCSLDWSGFQDLATNLGLRGEAPEEWPVLVYKLHYLLVN